MRKTECALQGQELAFRPPVSRRMGQIHDVGGHGAAPAPQRQLGRAAEHGREAAGGEPVLLGDGDVGVGALAGRGGLPREFVADGGGELVDGGVDDAEGGGEGDGDGAGDGADAGADEVALLGRLADAPPDALDVRHRVLGELLGDVVEAAPDVGGVRERAVRHGRAEERRQRRQERREGVPRDAPPQQDRRVVGAQEGRGGLRRGLRYSEE